MGESSFFIEVPAVPIPEVPVVPAVPAVPIPKSTAVLCSSDAVPIPVWNRIELQMWVLRFYAVFAVTYSSYSVGTRPCLIIIPDGRYDMI